MILTFKNRPLACGITAVLLVTVIGVVLANQGWKGRLLAFDSLPQAEAAYELITHGKLPERGAISSYMSYTPTGTSWLMAPGIFFFKDPRLFQSVGSLLTYFGTLLGIFLLSYKCFGMRCAFLSVLIYGLSRPGLFFAGSLWPRGHPFFFIWMVYWTEQWVTRREGKYLLFALVTWGAGMYVFMEIAPGLFILPVIWIIYRPPLRVQPLLVAGILILAIWYPYLRFEAKRNFIDLRSMVFQQSILPDNYKDSWCDKTLSLQTWQNPSPDSASNHSETKRLWFPEPANILQKMWNKAFYRITDSSTWNGLVGNFRRTFGNRIPGVDAVLLMLTLIMVLQSLPSAFWKSLPGIARAQVRHPEDKSEILVLNLLIPWLILLVLAEPGRSNRFLWLLPLQAVFLAGFFTQSLPKLQLPRSLTWVGQILVILILISQPRPVSIVDAWMQNGWSGKDDVRVRAVDYLASQLRSEGKHQAAIGYQIFIYGFETKTSMVDPHHKVGADFDFHLKHKHGITNTTLCTEGFSPNDEYRIVQTRPTVIGDQYFSIPKDSRFRTLGQIGTYQVQKNFE